MKQLVLVSHGMLCEELKKSTEMIMGTQDGIHTVSLLAHEGAEDFQKKLLATIEPLDEYIVLCDILGGTPCNVATRLLMEGYVFDLYAGMNMPMVIAFLNNELIGENTNLVHKAAEAIVYVNNRLTAMDDDEEE